MEPYNETELRTFAKWDCRIGIHQLVLVYFFKITGLGT